MISTVQTTVEHGSALLAMSFAFMAGLLSFFSPCVLPLVPGYVAFLGGAAGVQAVAPAKARHVSRAVAGAIAFVVGFSIVYISIGTVFGGLGQTLHAHQRTLSIVLGAVTIVLGLFFAGWLPGATFLNREVRSHWLPRATVGGAAMLGVLFSISWTPCIGPALGAILGLAGATAGATAWRGALLSGVYCLGLGLPFVAAAVATDKWMRLSRFIRRHTVWLLRGGGIFLIAIGVLEVTGTWATFTQWLLDHTNTYTPPI